LSEFGFSVLIRDYSLLWEEAIFVFFYNIDQISAVGTKTPIFGFVDTNVDIRVSACYKLSGYLSSV
jgi:hypothetical protein